MVTRLTSTPRRPAVSGFHGGRPHGASQSRLLDELVDRHHQHERYPENDDLDRGDDDRTDGQLRDLRGLRVTGGVRSPDLRGHVLQQDAERDRGQHGSQEVRLAQRTKTQPFDQDADDACTQKCDREGYRQRQAGLRGRNPDEGAEHEHVAVRDVQELEKPQDQGVAHGQQSVGAAEHEAVDELLREHPVP